MNTHYFYEVNQAIVLMKAMISNNISIIMTSRRSIISSIAIIIVGAIISDKNSNEKKMANRLLFMVDLRTANINLEF